MITYKIGNIFNQGTSAIVNPVNCVGVMGKGLALQFKTLFPSNFRSYRDACDAGTVVPGKMFTIYLPFDELYIINFPTKRHWKNRSLLSDIKLGLNNLVDVIIENDIKSIAIPPLGSGLGGLSWVQVKRLIDETLSPLEDVKIIVLEPIGS